MIFWLCGNLRDLPEILHILQSFIPPPTPLAARAPHTSQFMFNLFKICAFSDINNPFPLMLWYLHLPVPRSWWPGPVQEAVAFHKTITSDTALLWFLFFTRLFKGSIQQAKVKYETEILQPLIQLKKSSFGLGGENYSLFSHTRTLPGICRSYWMQFPSNSKINFGNQTLHLSIILVFAPS